MILRSQTLHAVRPTQGFASWEISHPAMACLQSQEGRWMGRSWLDACSLTHTFLSVVLPVSWGGRLCCMMTMDPKLEARGWHVPRKCSQGHSSQSGAETLLTTFSSDVCKSKTTYFLSFLPSLLFFLKYLKCSSDVNIKLLDSEDTNIKSLFRFWSHLCTFIGMISTHHDVLLC
jgi:hypothetical protein